MKYAVHYRKDFRHFDTVDEVIFSVEKGNENISELLPSIVKQDWQKITLNLLGCEKTFSEILPYILQLKELHPNILLQFLLNKENIEIAKENNIPFMAANRFCTSLDMVYAMKKMGVSEIYVVEGLGFHIDEVKKVLQDADIKIRVIPNVTQCASGTRSWIPTEHKFWIRPEDTKFYENDVDTFEIFNEDERVSVVYEIYKQQVWKGTLSEIILDAEDLNISNDAIPPYFGDSRINCKQRCFFGSCAACEANLSFAKTFEKTDMSIVYPKMVTTSGEELNESEAN